MAVIGNRIRQVLRILHTDGHCTAREVFDRMDGALRAREEANKYLLRATAHGYVQRYDGRPASYGITPAGVRLITQKADAEWPRKSVQRSVPRGPNSVFDLARTL